MWLPANRPGTRAFLAADAAGLAQENGRNAGLLSQNGDPAYVALAPIRCSSALTG